MQENLSGLSAITTPFRSVAAGRAIALAAGLVAFGAMGAEAQESYSSEVLQEERVGALDGAQKMRLVMFTMQPGAEVPTHSHSGPGLRYVLDGAIAISWKDGSDKTFEAGQTYFEGPGENHPAGEISAHNPTDQVTRVLIIETLPE